jgi:hypothetical protein
MVPHTRQLSTHLVHPRTQVWGQRVLHQGAGCDLGRILRQTVPGQACLRRIPGHHMPIQPDHLQLLLQPLLLHKQNPQLWSSGQYVIKICHGPGPRHTNRTTSSAANYIETKTQGASARLQASTISPRNLHPWPSTYVVVVVVVLVGAAALAWARQRWASLNL